ncbi:hypothetical protein ZTR_09321 [Talaromyces verruculosus]|nr:hypothetical protein ZTR_09321 [Talaromyces verruculosus]
MNFLMRSLLVFSAVSCASAFTTFSNKVVFNPPSTYTAPGVLYARTAQLPNGHILATWENYSPEPVYFPIYLSTDNGSSWNQIAEVKDTANSYGLRWEPHLLVLSEQIGSYPSGTVLLAGNSVPSDASSTNIDLYASTDSGYTWKFVSHIAKGGSASGSAIWEPFLMASNGQLVCYYSDSRDSAHSQKLSYQTSSDGVNWSSATNDIAMSKSSERPGMATIAELPNGNYIHTFEYGNSQGYPVYYRISSDPLNFNAQANVQLVASDGASLNSSPYVVYTSYGGINGTIIVNSAASGSLFINQALGSGQWKEIHVSQGGAYTRSLEILAESPKALLIMGAGYNQKLTRNEVTASVVDLSTLF